MQAIETAGPDHHYCVSPKYAQIAGEELLILFQVEIVGDIFLTKFVNLNKVRGFA